MIHTSDEKLKKKMHDWTQKEIKLKQEGWKDQRRGRLELEREIGQRQKAIKLLSKENALIRLAGGTNNSTGRNIGGLLGGRAGGAVGAGFDLLAAISHKAKEEKKIESEKEGPMTHVNKFKSLNKPGMKGDISRLKEAFSKTPMGRAGTKIKQKVGGMGTPVKIAGIAAGLAGAAGLSKMIIDSSPVLKSMLKLLNVGIMLILRPIGDFIGFMLRPLLLKFVKDVAIPAYKDGAKLAKKWGTKFGDTIVDFFYDPIGTISSAIAQAMKDIVFPTNPNGDPAGTLYGPDGSIVGEYKGLLDHVIEGLNKIFGGDGPVPEINACTGDTTILEKIDTNTKDTYDAITKWGEAFGLERKVIMEDNAAFKLANYGYDDVSSFEEAKAKGMDIWHKMNDEKSQGYRDQAIEDEKARQNKLAESGSLYPDYSNPYHKDGGVDDPSQKSIQVAFISEAAQRILNRVQNYKDGAAWECATPQDSTGGGGFCLGAGAAESREHMEVMSRAFEAGGEKGEEILAEYTEMANQARDATSNVTNSTTESDTVLMLSKSITGNYTTMADDSVKLTEGTAAAYDKIISALNRMRVYTSPSSGKRIFKKEATSVLDELGQARTVGAPDKYKVTWGSGKTKEMFLSAEALDYYKNTSGLKVTKMAKGGIINEPIFGMGQRSGKGYLMGESGPETITPGAGTSPGGSPTFNITINAHGINDLNQLKSTVLRLLKESTSRVGIV